MNQRFYHFLDRANQIHSNKFDYSQVVYINAKTPVRIICRDHGEFTQTPDQHLRVYNTVKHKNTGGCPICCRDSRKQTKRKPNELFISQAKQIHGDKYNYDQMVYTNTHTKIDIQCPTHGIFKMTPSDHIVVKQGCKFCIFKKQYSNIALRWLSSIMESDGIFIHHIGNSENEFIVPGTKYKVDGYCKETNTVYEFYGDKFHGNPSKYKSDIKCHPFNKNITAGELYAHTINRELIIHDKGFNIITMWEADFRCQLG